MFASPYKVNGTLVSTQSPHSNLTRIIPQPFESNHLGFVRGPLHDQTRPNIYEWNRRRRRASTFSGNGLRKCFESGVNPLPAATGITVIQLSHADDEPRHHGGYGGHANHVQHNHCRTIYWRLIVEPDSDVVQRIPSSPGRASKWLVVVRILEIKMNRKVRHTRGKKEPHLSQVVVCTGWAATAWLLCAFQQAALGLGWQQEPKV